MRILLVVNPMASSVTAATRAVAAEHLRRHHDLDVAATSRRGHATDLARAAAANGIDAVAVLGGDGTLNEVADALVGSDVVLAPLPGGSTNVFARSIGLPDDVGAAAVTVAAALAQDRTERIGVGEVTADQLPARAFLCHTGIGWDAALVAEVERRDHLKRRWTVPLFTWAGLRTFFRSYDRRRPHFGLRFAAGPGAPEVPDGCFTLVQNSDPYTFVGPLPLRVAPSADRHSGLTAVTLRSMSAVAFLRVMGQALATDRVRPDRRTDVRSDLHRFEVDRDGIADAAFPYQVDGDHLGSADRLVFTHRPDALRVVAVGS